MAWAYLDNARPFGFAHRGGNEMAPENTVAAFDHAWSLGYRYFETDVHRSADGVLVAFHDADLDRLVGRSANIRDLRWDELAGIDLGGGVGIPRFSDLVERFPDARWNVDPKADDAVEPLALAILEHGLIDRIGVGSFSDRRIATLKERLGPRLCTAAGPRDIAAMRIAAGRPNSAMARRIARSVASRHGCLQIPRSVRGLSVLTPSVIELAHRYDLQVHVWTINDAPSMTAVLDTGVDAVMTDKLGVLAAVLQERSTDPSATHSPE